MNIPNRLKMMLGVFLGCISILSMGAVFDSTGKEWINISGSSVAVTNSFSVSGSSVAVTNSLNMNGSTVSATNTLTVGTLPIVITGNGASVQVTNQPTVTIPNTTTVSATNSLTLANTTTVSATNTLTVGTMPIITTGNGASVQITNTPSVTLPNTTTVSATNQLTLVNTTAVSATNQLTLVNTTAVSATNSLTIGTLPALAAGSAQIGTVNGSTITVTNALQQHLVSVMATNANGYTPFMQVSAATINTNTWNGSACTLGFLTAFNSNASPRYICILDSATNRSPAEGSKSVLVQKYMIPGNTAGAGFVISLPPQGIKLVNGLVTATVTGMGTNDATAVAASEILLNGAYK